MYSRIQNLTRTVPSRSNVDEVTFGSFEMMELRDLCTFTVSGFRIYYEN
jgi:hypothetical protein